MQNIKFLNLLAVNKILVINDRSTMYKIHIRKAVKSYREVQQKKEKN